MYIKYIICALTNVYILCILKIILNDKKKKKKKAILGGRGNHIQKNAKVGKLKVYQRGLRGLVLLQHWR